MDGEDRRQLPIHFYLAQIAAELRKGRVTKPEQIKLEHFMLSFTPKPPDAAPGAPSVATDWKAKMRASKATWGGVLGLKVPKDASQN